MDSFVRLALGLIVVMIVRSPQVLLRLILMIAQCNSARPAIPGTVRLKLATAWHLSGCKRHLVSIGRRWADRSPYYRAAPPPSASAAAEPTTHLSSQCLEIGNHHLVIPTEAIVMSWC